MIIGFAKRRLHVNIPLFKWKKQYNPAVIPPPSAPSEKLEWLKIRPEPAIKEKTLTTEMFDGSIFHEIVRKKPLYEYLPENCSPELMEKVLPPVVEDHVHGKYPPRELSEDEIRDIVRLRMEDRVEWTVRSLAHKFQCSKAQIVSITKEKSRGKSNRRWKWWFGKRYDTAQVDYFKEKFEDWLSRKKDVIEKVKREVP